MKNRYPASFAMLAALSCVGAARAENLSSKLTDAVSAAASADSETASQGQSVTAAPADDTEREALTAEARDGANRALESSRAEQK